MQASFATDTKARLGFGCANLMGRVSRRESLRILDTAFDSGIRHFDTAPLYGFGEAESVLGDLLKRYRDRVTVATKFGIMPPKSSAALKVAKSIARGVVAVFPQLRRQIRRGADRMIEKGSFTINECRQSLQNSLRELRVDYVDVLLMHEVSADQITPGLVDFLEDARLRGLIRSFGTATTAQNTLLIRSRDLAVGEIAQFPNSIFENVLDEFPRRNTASIITHSSLGVRFRALADRLQSDRGLRQTWSRDLGFDCVDLSKIGALIIFAAMRDNSNGTVLFSSRNEKNICQNATLMRERIFSDWQLLTVKSLVTDFVQQLTPAGCVRVSR
jgi:aryl-alcohol dehydrogenase-like predicted oxidoreductase